MEGTSVRFLAEVGGRCCLERISLCLSVCLVCLACPHWSLLRFEGGRVGGCMLTYLLEGAVQTSVYILLVLPLVFFSTLLLFTSLTLHSLEQLQQQQQQQQHQYCLQSLHAVFFSPTESKL